jgi:hypothetical protein
LAHRRRFNEILSLNALKPLSTLYAPLSPNLVDAQALSSLSFKLSDPFHSSALMASVAHTLTMPYRTGLRDLYLRDLCQRIVPRPQCNVFDVQAAFPLHSKLPFFDASVDNRTKLSSSSSEQKENSTRLSTETNPTPPLYASGLLSPFSIFASPAKEKVTDRLSARCFLPYVSLICEFVPFFFCCPAVSVLS